jgi:hypothetical protein
MLRFDSDKFGGPEVRSMRNCVDGFIRRRKARVVVLRWSKHGDGDQQPLIFRERETRRERKKSEIENNKDCKPSR